MLERGQAGPLCQQHVQGIKPAARVWIFCGDRGLALAELEIEKNPTDVKKNMFIHAIFLVSIFRNEGTQPWLLSQALHNQSQE